MSWAGGWFFLMAAEQFTLGDHSFQLPGLGSYLQAAANAGNIGALVLGLATLDSPSEKFLLTFSKSSWYTPNERKISSQRGGWMAIKKVVP